MHLLGSLNFLHPIRLPAVLFGKALQLSGRARAEIGAGAIVSHMQMDCRIAAEGLVYVNQLWSIPLQILLCLALLYQQLGAAAFTGLAITAVLAPIIFLVTRAQRSARRRVMKCRDRRVKCVVHACALLCSRSGVHHSSSSFFISCVCFLVSRST